jgi:hypothetical protein
MLHKKNTSIAYKLIAFSWPCCLGNTETDSVYGFEETNSVYGFEETDSVYGFGEAENLMPSWKKRPYELVEIKHGHHTHAELISSDRAKLVKFLEGCKCCQVGVDLDEALGAAKANHEKAESLSGKTLDLSGQELVLWGSVIAPLSIIGLTAAYRNITGGIRTLKQLNEKIAYFEAIENKTDTEKTLLLNLYYSKFDSIWNIAVPGFLTAVSSGLMLASPIWASPYALPVLSGYGYLMGARNIGDIIRIQRLKSPEVEEAQSETEKIALQKIKEIRNRKTAFFSMNSLMFFAMGTGALLLFLGIAASAVFTGGASVVGIGIGLLVAGAIGSSYSNNTSSKKFRPRNGALNGIDRRKLTKADCLHHLGVTKRNKTILKQFIANQSPTTRGTKLKKCGWKLLSALPFLSKTATRRLHHLNLQTIKKHHDAITKNRSDLLESLVKNQNRPVSQESGLMKDLEHFEQLGLLDAVVQTYAKKTLPDPHEHHHHSHHHSRHKVHSCCETHSPKDHFLKTGLFDSNGTEELMFNADCLCALPETHPERLRFEEALNECLISYKKELAYTQYALNDQYLSS